MVDRIWILQNRFIFSVSFIEVAELLTSFFFLLTFPHHLVKHMTWKNFILLVLQNYKFAFNLLWRKVSGLQLKVGLCSPLL